MNVYGLDTETCKGKVFSIQFSSEKGEKILWVNHKNVTEKFLDLLGSLPYSKGEKSVIYVLNLLFDFCQCFYPYWKEIILQEKCGHKNEDGETVKDGKFELKINGWTIAGFITDQSQFAEIRKGKRIFWMVDIGRFFVGISLDKAIKTLLHEKGKETAPKLLGKKIYTKTDKNFVKYALWDVRKTQQIGKIITDFHHKWDITQTWSIAQLAERIFRHHFMTEEIEGTPYKMVRHCLYSYHGGRNGYYRDKPEFFPKCYSYDIVSTYPYAMIQLPNFKNGEYYEVEKFEKDYVGIYKISGKVSNCKYPILFNNNFSIPKDYINEQWVTCYELNEALDKKEIKLDSISGYIFYPKNNEQTPLQKYVSEFVRLKKETNKENDPANYEFFKRLLNALYGKFIQMREETLEDNSKRFVTGKMFHPFIGSLITGHARAQIHELEHKFKSIHTSTDSIKTLIKIPNSYLSKDLGGLSLEVYGPCLIMRNRLYLHFEKKVSFKKEDGQYKYLKKYALHAFQGTPENVWELWKNKTKKYASTRMLKPVEAIRQKREEQAFDFLTEERNINIEY